MQGPEDKNKQAVAVFNKYAEEYQAKFMDPNLYADTLDLFCELINTENPSVLDAACGPGNISKYLLNKKPAMRIFGIDLADNMVRLAQQNNPAGHFEVMDCRAIETLHQQFDAVMCSFCLPYLSKEETSKLFADVNHLLNEAGVFYVSTMEDDYAASGYETGSKGDQVFMHYYKADDLVAELEKYGFSIADISRKNTIMTNNKPVVDLTIIARKNHSL